MGGDYVDGGLFSSPFYADSDRIRWGQFKSLYEGTHRRPVNRFSAYGYDAARDNPDVDGRAACEPQGPGRADTLRA